MDTDLRDILPSEDRSMGTLRIKFTAEFKLEAVRLITDLRETVAAPRLDLSETGGSALAIESPAPARNLRMELVDLGATLEAVSRLPERLELPERPERLERDPSALQGGRSDNP